MMTGKTIIAPIASDFGAAKSGVYYAHYPEGSALSDIEKHGEVLTYDKDKYTVMLKDRTARRHTRRIYDRRKMAKRLLSLVLENHFDFPARKHLQALGYLMNRRGYTRLEDSYNTEYLEAEDFPNVVLEELRETAKDHFNEPIADCMKAIEASIDSGETDKIKKIVDLLQKKNAAAAIFQSLPDVANRQKESKNNLWNFDITKFDLETKQTALEKPGSQAHNKAHLQHICHALWKMHDMLQSGHRHRRDYFNEIRKTLKEIEETSKSRRDRKKAACLTEFADAVAQCEKLDNDKLARLTGHISNLELKPLRSYFKSKSHKGEDKWHPEKLAETARKWFMKQWRVSEEKDGSEMVKTYRALKTKWQEWPRKDDIIGFWLMTEPELTIPPYQSMSNRRPPKCQSLLLNPDYMNDKYPEWREWIHPLIKNGLSQYKKSLEDVAELAPYQPPHSPDKDKQEQERRREKEKQEDRRKVHLELRVLQFLLDARRDTDPRQLNEIWSRHHKAQQQRRGNRNDSAAVERMEAAIEKSRLPDELKAELRRFEQPGGFGHFVNAYYQARRKARDGRYFIHQEKKERWLTDGKLFCLCPHKPRHKRHQWESDLAAIFGIAAEDLKKVAARATGSGDCKDWLDRFRIKPHCDAAAKAQKKHRGELKIRISMQKDKSLVDLNRRSGKFALKIAGELWPNVGDEKRKQYAKRFESVFSFAQIDNIVYKERSGFSGTCPVCSHDNSERMQTEDDGKAKAARLPALSVRLIDGAVMRICEALSARIAKRRWLDIEQHLNNGGKVRVPLIMEQNRFEFEPELALLKGKTAKSDKEKGRKEKEWRDRIKRIKEAGYGVSPYSGKDLGNDGEIDHIIPRSSEYGVLNDEANLIYASKEDNAKHGNRQYTLSNLSPAYKEKVFGVVDDKVIRQRIETTLEAEGDDFAFGRYISFINLDEEQQKAFRHALFLPKNHRLRDKVIRAINNRNRAIVNGTQRYLAQCIADKLYAMAQTGGIRNPQKQLEFDYFEYSAKPDDPRSTYLLRKKYENALVPGTSGECLVNYGKQKGVSQHPYSHLADAHMAFLLAAEQHRGDGSMGIDLSGSDLSDGRTFTDTAVDPNSCVHQKLSRKKAEKGVRPHRPFTGATFYGLHYLPLLVGREKDGAFIIKAGFSWDNSAEIWRGDKPRKGGQLRKTLPKIMRFTKKPEPDSGYDGLPLEKICETLLKNLPPGKIAARIVWDKEKIHQYLVDEFSNRSLAEGQKWDDNVRFFDRIHYRTERKRIDCDGKEITVKVKSDNKDIILDDFLQNEGAWEVKLDGKAIILPAMKDWERLRDEWKKRNGKDASGFLREHFGIKKVHSHQRVRKQYSLPVITGQGKILHRGQSWNGKPVYQLLDDSDSRKDGNKPMRMVLSSGGELKNAMNSAFASGNQFKVTEDKNMVSRGAAFDEIDTGIWHDITEAGDCQWPDCISCVCVKVGDDRDKPKIKIRLSDNYNPSRDMSAIANFDLLKAKNQKQLKDWLKQENREDAGMVREYASSGSAALKRQLVALLSSVSASAD